MVGERGRQTPAFAPTGGNDHQTQPEFAGIDLLSPKNGIDIVSNYNILYSRYGNMDIRRTAYN
jgi:hypothetical protein